MYPSRLFKQRNKKNMLCYALDAIYLVFKFFRIKSLLTFISVLMSFFYHTANRLYSEIYKRTNSRLSFAQFCPKFTQNQPILPKKGVPNLTSPLSRIHHNIMQICRKKSLNNPQSRTVLWKY